MIRLCFIWFRIKKKKIVKIRHIKWNEKRKCKRPYIWVYYMKNQNYKRTTIFVNLLSPYIKRISRVVYMFTEFSKTPLIIIYHYFKQTNEGI